MTDNIGDRRYDPDWWRCTVQIAADYRCPRRAEVGSLCPMHEKSRSVAFQEKLTLELEEHRIVERIIDENLRSLECWDQMQSGYGLGGPENPDLAWARSLVAECRSLIANVNKDTPQ